MRTHALMERLLQRMVDAGQLAVDEVPRACVQFFALIKGDLFMRRMFGCVDCTESYAAEIEATARAGVATFLRAYAPR